MKKLIFTCYLLTMMMTMGAQRYMRYHMNDSTFNGFYTDCVDSILHSVDLTQVYANGQVYEIPLANVDSVTFEGVNLATDADDMVGRYRIYEYEVSPTDSMYKIYKKAYFDNRALLITSKTGEFGANDTIMIQSEFYGGRLLMFTDGEGKICRIFDGNYMLDILYHKDGSSTVHLFSESSDSILATLELPIDLFDKYSYTRAVSVSSLQKALKGFAKKFKQDILPQLKPYLKEKAVTTLLVEGAVKLGEVLTDIESDPNYRNRVLLIDGVQVVGDLMGIGITALGGILTGGALWAALGVEYGLLMKDFHELMGDCLPSSEVTEKYKKYYKQKYGLMLHTLPAVEVTETSATLKGNVYTTDGIKGNVYFRLWDYKDYDKDVSATIEDHDDNYKYSLSARVEALTPDKEYVYYVCYECTINGMRFNYYSDDYVEFRTKEEPHSLCPDDNHPHAIDLGLPSGTKWACCNVGAPFPEANGGYYAWGETKNKWKYDKTTYKGTSYDAAHVTWGGDWRMPTFDEMVELVNNCTWKWTTYNDVNYYFVGYFITGSNGNSIVLPAAGYFTGPFLRYRGQWGCYWSATLYNSTRAHQFHLRSDVLDCGPAGFTREYGCSVRPVTE